MFLVSFFQHAKAIGAAAQALGVAASVELDGFTLRVGSGASAQTWHPRFLANFGAGQAYVDTAVQDLAGFAGWMPYPLRQWPLACDKVAFKQFAAAKGIATPGACNAPEHIGGPFLVKHARSSFGQGIRGPFLSFHADASEQRLQEHEYFENFVVGHIAKAWCWGDRCVALELKPPNTVTGDGRSSLRELVSALPSTRVAEHDWPLLSRLAEYCGLPSVDDVVPAGKQVLVEYRYGSRYTVPPRHNTNLLPQLQGNALAAQFADAARVLSQTVPAGDPIAPSLYTLDAIVDADGLALFLEMNCNPLVHPDAYAPMLASAFTAPTASTAPMPPRNRSATMGAIAS